MASQIIFPSYFHYAIPGYADFSTLEPYRENTLTTMFSSTKGISALCVALLVDRQPGFYVGAEGNGGSTDRGGGGGGGGTHHICQVS